MGLFDRILGFRQPAATAAPAKVSAADPVANPPAPAPGAGATPPGATGGTTPTGGTPPNGATPGTNLAATAPTPEKKGLLRKMGSNIRRAVDGYVDRKADALLDDATKRAEEFREETLEIVQNQAMQLLDITEQRIDRKLQDIENLLEQRLQAELRMRLRALIWTLAFVLLMAIISVLYVWIKRSAGLENAPAAGRATASPVQTARAGL